MKNRTIAVYRLLALLAALLTATTVSAATGRECVDPCIQAARGARQECVSSASGVFREALDGCLERDHTCVDACRAARHDCRDATSLGEDLLSCDLALIAAKAECRSEFPPGSVRQAICIDRARIDGFRCRRHAVRRARRDLSACESAFAECTQTCGAGGPPGGPDTCRSEAKDAREAAHRDCKTTFRATTAACINKDVTCVHDCLDARDACDASARTTVDGAIASCNAERDAALAACRAANPSGSEALEQCERTVQANALACREAALQAAIPVFGACAASYVRCVRTCPSA